MCASPLQRRSVGDALRCMAERVSGSNETDVCSVVADITGRLAVDAAETASSTGHWTLDTGHCLTSALRPTTVASRRCDADIRCVPHPLTRTLISRRSPSSAVLHRRPKIRDTFQELLGQLGVRERNPRRGGAWRPAAKTAECVPNFYD